MNNYIEVFPEISPPRVYELAQLNHQWGDLTLHLEGKEKRVISLFFHGHLAYRRLYEGDASLALNDLYRTATPGRSFYKVEDSDFVKWFLAQSHGIHEDKLIQHFVICTVDDIIDVLSETSPEIKISQGRS
jgi:hypothetical protein